MRMGGLGRGGRSSRSRNCFSMGGWEAADGGGGRGGQGAGEVAAFEDGAAGAVDGAGEGSFGYSASWANAGDWPQRCNRALVFLRESAAFLLASRYRGVPAMHLGLTKLFPGGWTALVWTRC